MLWHCLYDGWTAHFCMCECSALMVISLQELLEFFVPLFIRFVFVYSFIIIFSASSINFYDQYRPEKSIEKSTATKIKFLFTFRGMVSLEFVCQSINISWNGTGNLQTCTDKHSIYQLHLAAFINYFVLYCNVPCKCRCAPQIGYRIFISHTRQQETHTHTHKL